jgi:hypothetical protein
VRRYGKLHALTHGIELADGRGIECHAPPRVAQTIPLDHALRVPTWSIQPAGRM